MTVSEHHPMVPTPSTTVRSSKLPSRCSNSKIQSSNNNRSSSIQKVSKLPIRTNSLNRQQTPTKKSNIPTPAVAKTKPKDTTIASNRSITSVNNSTIKKTTASQPPVIQLSSNKTRSTTEKNPIPCSKTVKSNDPIQQMNTTSSESSIEEQQQMNKLLPIVQDEGYSTWSSIDVKDDIIKKNEIDDREKNIGLVQNWLDISNRQCSKKPVKEGEIKT